MDIVKNRDFWFLIFLQLFTVYICLQLNPVYHIKSYHAFISPPLPYMVMSCNVGGGEINGIFLKFIWFLWEIITYPEIGNSSFWCAFLSFSYTRLCTVAFGIRRTRPYKVWRVMYTRGTYAHFPAVCKSPVRSLWKTETIGGPVTVANWVSEMNHDLWIMN